MKALVFAGAKIDDYDFCQEYFADASLIICCDGGLHHAKALGLVPDYIVGDFDSVAPDVLQYFQAMNIPTYQFPTRKNETDMQLGIRLALEKGADDLVLFGGIGDRFDHTLANGHLLLWILKAGARARLVDSKNCVELISDSLTFLGKEGQLVSTLPLSMEVRGLTLRGFSYPLTNHTLALDDELVAVSNVIVEERATISLTEGYLFVICARD